MVSYHSCRGNSVSGIRIVEPPALFTQMVKLPKVSTAACPNANTASSSVTSVVTAMAFPPLALMRSATAVISSVLLAARTTEAPASAKSNAMPSPIPRPAPVTTATCPVKSNRSCSFMVLPYYVSNNVPQNFRSPYGGRIKERYPV